MSVKLLKQYRNLIKNVGNFTDGQVEISDVTATDSDDSLELICLTVSPKSGPYRGGRFAFTLILKGFPIVPPEVVCQTRIYHPNIDLDGVVCLNLLGKLWTPTTTMEDVVQGILFLFYQPNVDDPISEMFNGREPYKVFRQKVQTTLRGGCVGGFTFERNLPENYQDVQTASDGADDNEPWPSQWEGESESEGGNESISANIDDLRARLAAIEELISELRETTTIEDGPASPEPGGSLVVSRMINRFLFLPEWILNFVSGVYRKSYNFMVGIWNMWRHRT